MPRSKTLVILSQVFVPDPASVGQHIADVAVEMARRGHRVIVYASARGYEDPSRRYPIAEDFHGVEVRRFDFASFGKRSILTRVLGTVSFMAQVFFRVVTEPEIDAIFFSTSPPLIGFIGTIIGYLRQTPTAYWAMDLNPDQLIALGKLQPRALPTRILEAINRFILRRTKLIIALDRFMADRLENRMPLADKTLVMPPWPHENHIADDTAKHDDQIASADTWPANRDQNPFRQNHGLVGKFVVMYSGNHSPSNPLATLLAATLRFRDDPYLRFLFVGGGLGKKEVDAHLREHRLANVISLPYQPIENLKFSLAAADVHVVSLGGDMVGIIHPCKIYGAMAAGRPILYLGPRPSHISDLLDAHAFGWTVTHGDIVGCERAIKDMRATPAAKLAEMGSIARRVLDQSLTQQLLCGRFCDALERSLKLRQNATATSLNEMKPIAIALLLLGLGSIGCNKTIREANTSPANDLKDYSTLIKDTES